MHINTLKQFEGKRVELWFSEGKACQGILESVIEQYDEVVFLTSSPQYGPTRIMDNYITAISEFSSSEFSPSEEAS
jgi:hypothetical protein